MIVSIILIVIVIAGLVVYFDNSSASKTPESTPPLLYLASISNINASQDTTQQLNLTLTSICSTEIEIPIENLTINGYTSATSYNGNVSSPWSTSLQETVLNYSFSLSQLILQPSMSNSTMITIHLAHNASLGSYSLDIDLGKIIFLSEPKKNDISYAESSSLVMVVTPSANLVTALNVNDTQEETVNLWGNETSNLPFNNLLISGSVTNTGKVTAFYAGLHVVAYTATGTLEVNITVPLVNGAGYGTDTTTDAFVSQAGTTWLQFGSLDIGQTAKVNVSIYHEGTVTNWTVTPVWTNLP
jgi:hypothetical protein